MNYKDMIACELSNKPITALTVHGQKSYSAEKQRQKFTEYNILCSNNENPQIKATSSVHEVYTLQDEHLNIFSARVFATLNYTFNVAIISFRSWSQRLCWSVVVELELIDDSMVSVLAHTEKLSQRSFARASNYFSTIFCHSVFFAVESFHVK